MDRPNVAGDKLTVAQFRMLQRIPDEGLPLSALRQRRGYRIAAQIRTLRILTLLELVVETKTESGEVRFEITDAGRKLVEPDGVR
jgi:hypothetical protein